MEDDILEQINCDEQAKDVVPITEQDKYFACEKCSFVNNSSIRSRMIANNLSVLLGIKILENYGLQCNTSISLQEISSIALKWDIAEIFVGNCRISVRNNFLDYKLFVPKKHKRYGLLGDLLMFVRFEDNCAKLLGFLNPSDLDEENSDNENYYIDIDSLKPLEEINFNINKKDENIEELKKYRLDIIRYYDGLIEDKIEFFKLLSNSKYLREEMIKFEKSEEVFSEIVLNEENIQKELKIEVDNISKLADAFIQSKNEILRTGENENQGTANEFKLECARANLERLFNLPLNEENNISSIHDKTTAEVMDTLLKPSETIIQDDRLPMYEVLKAFRFFAIIFLVIFFTAGIFCYYNYELVTNSNNLTRLKHNIAEWVINVKKK